MEIDRCKVAVMVCLLVRGTENALIDVERTNQYNNSADNVDRK